MGGSVIAVIVTAAIKERLSSGPNGTPAAHWPPPLAPGSTSRLVRIGGIPLASCTPPCTPAWPYSQQQTPTPAGHRAWSGGAVRARLRLLQAPWLQRQGQPGRGGRGRGQAPSSHRGSPFWASLPSKRHRKLRPRTPGLPGHRTASCCCRRDVGRARPQTASIPRRGRTTASGRRAGTERLSWGAPQRRSREAERALHDSTWWPRCGLPLGHTRPPHLASDPPHWPTHLPSSPIPHAGTKRP